MYIVLRLIPNGSRFAKNLKKNNKKKKKNVISAIFEGKNPTEMGRVSDLGPHTPSKK